MKKEAAEEYTQSLGQIVAGSWRQILWAEEQGVPKALGLSTRDWVQQRLGGYVQMSIPERREAVKELAANGHSTREIAEVVGVDQKTVVRDIHAEENASEPQQPQAQDLDTDRGAEENASAQTAKSKPKSTAQLERDEAQWQLNLRRSVYEALHQALFGLNTFATGNFDVPTVFSPEHRAEFIKAFSQEEFVRLVATVPQGLQKLEALTQKIREIYEL